jgi:hypothetical protein
MNGSLGKARAVSLVVGLLTMGGRARSEEQQPIDYQLSARNPLPIAILSPSKAFASTSVSEIGRIANDVLAERTDLSVELLDATVPEDQQKFTWFTRRARVDGNASPRNSGGRKPARFLVVINVRAVDTKDRVSAILLDADESLRCIETGAHTDNPKEDETSVEDCILHSAVRSNLAPKLVEKNGVEAYLRQVFLEAFRSEFERKGDWEPYGRLTLEGAAPGLRIEIDRRPIGTTKLGRTSIGAIDPGAHSILVEGDADYEPVEAAFTVERGKTSLVSVPTVTKSGRVARTVRTAMTWTGVGVAVLGGALTAYGINQANTMADQRVCLSHCTSGSGHEIAQLGYSLGAMGIAWTLGANLVGDDDSFPWIALGGGVAVFAAVFLVSRAIDGGL